MDEPFSNIDANMRAGMRGEVEQILRDNNVTTVFVTHDRDEALSMGNRIAVIGNGRIEQIDVPEVLHGFPATKFVASMTSNCGFVDGRISGQEVITELGSFAWKSGEDLTDGDVVYLVAHAGDFVCSLDIEGINVVKSRDFRGDETIILVRLNSGTVLPCRVNYSSAFNAGSKVTLTRSSNEPLFALKKSNPRQ
jgi:iron(III) transport system ATP-binding protein